MKGRVNFNFQIALGEKRNELFLQFGGYKIVKCMLRGSQAVERVYNLCLHSADRDD